MSWAAVGDAFKQGMQSERKTGKMRDANDPTGVGFGGGPQAPAPVQQRLPTLNDLPATPGYTATPAGVGPVQPLQAGPANVSPLQSLLAQIWKRPQPSATR